MKLSSRVRHALRLAVEVSRRKDEDRPVRLSEVARITNLSRKFLEQLAGPLRSHLILRSVSGRNGGFVLARPPDQITVGQVMAAVIGPIILTDCLDRPDGCMAAEFCECRMISLLLRRQINDVLDGCTLADLTDRNWVRAMREDLARPATPRPAGPWPSAAV
ncbi:MAG: Rrf2 family transcriptional regulator [Deltaproteobacteria bacterium]|nr:Rrf2 family transcriptional regulator [Deltaproteobacteria bacterium]